MMDRCRFIGGRLIERPPSVHHFPFLFFAFNFHWFSIASMKKNFFVFLRVGNAENFFVDFFFIGMIPFGS